MIIQRFFTANRTLAALLAGNVFLLAVLGAEWLIHTASSENFTKKLQQKSKPPELFAALPEFEIPLEAEDEYAGIVEHPLFLEGRAPVENTEETQALAQGNSAAGDMNMSLSGIAVLPDAVLALLTDKAGKHYRVKKGEALQGWEVESVQDDKIVMTNGTERREILLREFKNNKASTPGIAVPPVAPKQAQRPGSPGQRPDSGRPGAPAQHDSVSAPPPPPAQNPGAETSESENADPETEDQ